MAEPNFRALAQELFDQLSAYDECHDEEEVSQHWNYTNCNELLHRARTDLATPPPEPLRPIPVSERLPEAGEWVWHCYTGVRFWEHGRYYSRQKSQPARHWFFIGDGPESQPATHWLPANAIPFPEVTQ